eukprot:741404-Prymnesium_polylepis.2
MRAEAQSRAQTLLRASPCHAHGVRRLARSLPSARGARSHNRPWPDLFASLYRWRTALDYAYIISKHINVAGYSRIAVHRTPLRVAL